MKSLRSCVTLLALCLAASACGDSPSEVREADAMVQVRMLPGAATPGTSVSPSVRLTDEDDQPVAGAVVTFEVTAGGGSVSAASVTSNSSGLAVLPSWTLGPGLVANTLVARHGDLPPVTFTIMGCAAYCIDIRYVGTVSAQTRTAFENARTRWEQVITADLAPVQLNISADVCRDVDGNVLVNNPALNEQVDDLIVYVQIDSIDGPGQVVGVAGPCFIRNTSRLPVFGIMLFDVADLASAADRGFLGAVILHELGHVFGFPTLWSDSTLLLLEGKGGSNPYYTGARGASEFTLAGGTLINGEGVPVENTGSEGTRDSHWRESVLSNELMTGFVSSGSNPLSAITIGSLQDIGYEVNFAAADPYTVPAAGVPAGRNAARMQIVERRLPAPRAVF